MAYTGIVRRFLTYGHVVWLSKTELKITHVEFNKVQRAFARLWNWKQRLKSLLLYARTLDHLFSSCTLRWFRISIYPKIKLIYRAKRATKWETVNQQELYSWRIQNPHSLTNWSVNLSKEESYVLIQG